MTLVECIIKYLNTDTQLLINNRSKEEIWSILNLLHHCQDIMVVYTTPHVKLIIIILFCFLSIRCLLDCFSLPRLE